MRAETCAQQLALGQTCDLYFCELPNHCQATIAGKRVIGARLTAKSRPAVPGCDRFPVWLRELAPWPVGLFSTVTRPR